MRIRSEAADARAQLAGRLVPLLESALTPLEGLDDVNRQNLVYQATAAESAENRFLDSLLARFTGETDRKRFEDTLRTYYLEAANSGRVIKDLEDAREVYVQMSQICVRADQDLKPATDSFKDVVALRLFDYHAARYGAAVTRHPERRARLEESFREEYGPRASVPSEPEGGRRGPGRRAAFRSAVPACRRAQRRGGLRALCVESRQSSKRSAGTSRSSPGSTPRSRCRRAARKT